jgi:hypothetical protein
MSGFTLAQEAKRLRPSLSVLYATNWPVEPPGSNLPAHLGILKKPYGLGHLRSRVRAMTA